MTGYRTYASLAAAVLIQILKSLGVEIGSEALTTAIEVLLIVAAGLFHFVHKPAKKEEGKANENLSKSTDLNSGG